MISPFDSIYVGRGYISYKGQRGGMMPPLPPAPGVSREITDQNRHNLKDSGRARFTVWQAPFRGCRGKSLYYRDVRGISFFIEARLGYCY